MCLTTSLQAQIDENQILFKDSFLLITKNSSIAIKGLYDKKTYFYLKKDSLQSEFQDCYFIPNSNNILIVTLFGNCYIWDWKQNQKLCYLKLKSGNPDHGFSEGVKSLKFTKTGSFFSIIYNANEIDYYDVRKINFKDTIKPITFFYYNIPNYNPNYRVVIFDLKDSSALIKNRYDDECVKDTIYKFNLTKQKIVLKLFLKNGSYQIFYNLFTNEIFNTTENNKIEIYDATTFKLKKTLFYKDLLVSEINHINFYDNCCIFNDSKNSYLLDYKFNNISKMSNHNKTLFLSNDKKYSVSLPDFDQINFGNRISLKKLNSNNELIVNINDQKILLEHFYNFPQELKNYILSNTSCINNVKLKLDIEKAQLSESGKLILVYKNYLYLMKEEKLLVSIYKISKNKVQKLFQNE